MPLKGSASHSFIWSSEHGAVKEDDVEVVEGEGPDSGLLALACSARSFLPLPLFE